MRYNRRNYLLRVKLICELFIDKRVEDVPTSKTFYKFINPIYPMTLNTFYQLLNINYDKELKELDAKKEKEKQEQKQQLKLFENDTTT